DDFAGGTITLTNPGGLGTVASVPRLMAGPGSIIAGGAIKVPAEYQGLGPAELGRPGIGKGKTITRPYDHRVIQGAESGEFLRTLEQFLQGENGFYTAIETALGLAGPAREEPAHERASAMIPIGPSITGRGPEARPTSGLAEVAAAMGLVKA